MRVANIKSFTMKAWEEAFWALLQIVENRCAPRRPTLIQRGVLGRPAAGWAPRRYQTA